MPESDCSTGSTTSTSASSSASSSRHSTGSGGAPVPHSFKRKSIAFLPLLFCKDYHNYVSAESLGLVTLLDAGPRMASRGMDRSVRQTIPSTRRKARSPPRSSSVSSDMRSVSKLEAQDLIEAEREYQRQEELEKCASELAMEAMEYKFLSRRKRLMARKLLRESKERSDPKLDSDLIQSRQQLRTTRLDSNGNIVSVVPMNVPTLATGGPSQHRLNVQRSVAPDLALQITTRMDLKEPELLLEKPGAGRESTTDQSLRSKHDREMKKYDESESNGRKRSHRFTASLIRTTISDSEQEPEEDSGYEAKSGITDTTAHTMDPSRAVSRGSFSSSLRPFSSDFESAWGSQELLESDSSARKKSVKSRSSDDDREHDTFQDAEESLESIRQYGDFEAGGIETQAGYEVIDLPPTRIDVKDKASDKSKDTAKPMLIKPRKPVREGRRSTSDPVRDRLSAQPGHMPSVVRRGSTAMPYHFAMPTAPVSGYMKPTVASLRARYERDDLEGAASASARDRYKISEEDSYRINKVEEELKNKKLEEERTKRYEDWLKKLDEVDVIPQSAKERVKKLEDELFRLKKATEESETSMARAYRRRLLEGDDSEFIFPMSRKTQTKPEPQYQMKMISRTTQTDDKSNRDVAINTEIDYRLMSALLDKLLVAKTSVSVQTDWKSDVIETRDVAVSTDRLFRERFSALPNTRSMSVQTEVSALKFKDESVATDPEITGHRHRNRLLREPQTIRLSSAVQTDQKWISRKDVSCEANFSSFSSESEDSVVVSSPYPKGFHPKTGQLLDESLLSNYQEINDNNVNRFGVRSRDQNYHKLSKTPEPIIEEYGTSSTSTESESNSEGDYSCENVREVYRERVSEYKSGSKPTQKSYYHMKSEEKKFNLDYTDHKKPPKEKPLLETDFQHYDREPHRPEFRHKFTADRRPESRHEVSFKSPQITPPPPPKPMPIMKSTETQTNGQLMTVAEQSAPKPVMRVSPKDLKTESKITVEVTKANKKERSEVTSQTKMDDEGKMRRTTQVTTSKHIPIQALNGSPMHQITGGRKTPTSSITSPQRPLSPMRKAQSEINVTPVSNVSTRPSSADDLSMGQTTAQKMPSTLSFGSSYPSRSSLKTPSPTFKHYNSDEINVPKVGRVSIQDPLHMVVLAPPESFDNKAVSMNGNGFLMPIDKSRWKETSSSTICNEMTTDAFKDEDGKAQKPKSISMSTETLIESKGNESSVKTRSRTARKYGNEAEEKAIASETSYAGPGGLLKNDFPYIESEPTSRAFSPPHRTSSSPVVTLIDTPEFLSPEPPEQMPKSTRLSHSTESGTPSLVTDVRTSRYRPDEDYNKRLVQNTSRRAAVVEPVQQYSTVTKSDTSGTPVTPQPVVSSAPTEIITRIIRTSELDESKKFRKSKTVFEQELQSGRDGSGGGCHISSSIAFDNPNPPNRGVIIREINEDGTSKDGSTDNLDQKSGELVTETSFQCFKTPKRGVNGCEETSWKYSVECNNVINGSNTSVRTTIDYKRIKYPLTSYETSL